MTLFGEDAAPVQLSEHGVLVPFKSISGLFAVRSEGGRPGLTRYSTFPWRCIGPVGAGTPPAGSSVTANASKL